MTDAAWEGTSGRVSDFEGEVKEAYFSYGTGQSAERTYLYLKVQPTDGTDPESDDGLVEMRYSCGSNWRTLDGGETVEHDRGGQKFHNQSAYYAFIARVVDLVGKDELEKVFGSDGPRTAKVWEGCKFYFEEEDSSFQQDGKKVESTRVMPVKFLGKGKVSSSASGAPSSAGLDKLRELAKQSSSHSDWITRAMGLPEVASNGSLVEMLGDPSNFEKMKGE